MSFPIHILLADDHRIVRQGLRRILEEHPQMEVVAEASDGREAVQLALEKKPDVVVMDIGMPHLNGMEAARQILRRLPATKILVLSMYSDESYVVQVLEAGAKGYLLKDSADAELVEAVQAVSNGKSFFSPLISRILLDEYVRQLQEKKITDRYELLTEREREILQLIAEGQTSREIAELLNVSVSTVDTHRGHIMEKLDLHNPYEVVLYAVRKGLIS
ncbi:MAG: DNA-binding response regulator [Acidobacteria bacterium RIFCSPLOWO2_02_FULL_59_13]|nr:MAG: DNA-binding response regulator [Acidobacteria bacterium RIFCSPLOWO2_02_FULL_59_13]